MLKTIVIVFLAVVGLFLLTNGTNNSLAGVSPDKQATNSGTLEKMIVSDGSVTMDVNLSKLNGAASRTRKAEQPSQLRFNAEQNSFFTVVVFNNELRGALPGSMPIIPQNFVNLPAKLNGAYSQLVLERTAPGEPYEFIIRDSKTGFLFFNIEGFEFTYDPADHSVNIKDGRMLISNEFAAELRRPADAGAIVGQFSMKTNMRAIEVTQVVDGEVTSNVLPPVENPDNAGTVPGPDVVVGDLSGLAQFGGSSGTQVGLAVGTDSCNFGTVDLNWFQNPANDHPVIPQNLYRMSGGTSNNDRFEQVGQSSVKHAFTALTQNLCNLGCNGTGGSRLGSGCSDPYSASLNSGQGLGSRAFINPFTGYYPRGDDPEKPNNVHGGHSHTGPSHRILTEIADLNTSLNQGSTYYAEAQYITPHEYVWCQANPTQCNMYNNVSYRRYNVNGTGSPFSFTAVGATVRAKTAITAWTGATIVDINPAPGADGIGSIGYKVTNPSPGVYRYEYAIYNQNLDRAIQSFSVPVGSGATVTNVGFHAPPQHPGWANDGTFNNAGFSSAPWAQSNAGGAMTWSSETFAQNPNANAIRWGTLYNFRFESNRPPQTVTATIGFLKTGAPITVQIQGPSPAQVTNVSISGRVVTSGGQGIGGMLLALTDAGGNFVAFASTSSFGAYSFTNVVPGGPYTVEPLSKRYSFSPITMPITSDVTDMNFVADPN